MMPARMLGACALGLVFLTQPLLGEPLSQYRGFALDATLRAVSAAAEINPTDVKTIHQRPSVLQELEWRLSRWNVGTLEPSTDPVGQITFGFLDDHLYRIVVDYQRERTEGLTDADMIAAISASYGPPAVRGARQPPQVVPPVDVDSGPVVARWGDSMYALTLYRTATYRSSFRLIVEDIRVSRLARQAAAEASRLDQREAPSREIARQKKEKDDERDAAEKTRVGNKAGFRP